MHSAGFLGHQTLFCGNGRGSPYVCAVRRVLELAGAAAVLPADVDGRAREVDEHVAHQFGGAVGVKVHPHVMLRGKSPCREGETIENK